MSISKKSLMTYVIFICTIILVGTVVRGEGRVHFTTRWVDFYGYAAVEVGDIVTVRDSDGVLCGYYEVIMDGRYGPVHVYGDDTTTLTIDEGADIGQALFFHINGIEAEASGGEEILWVGDGASMRVDLLKQSFPK